MMELTEWAQQLKNLAGLLSSQPRSNSLDTEFLFLSLYALVYLSSPQASRGYSLLAFLFCATVAYTPIYTALSEVQYYCLFAVTYALLTHNIKITKAKVACCLLSCFQLLMAMDSYANANIETIIWRNYELIVCLLHAAIICTFCNWNFAAIKRGVGNFADKLLDNLRNTCNSARVWYYYAMH